MTVTKGVRLVKAAKEINVGIDTVVEHLRQNGFEVDSKPTTKLSTEMYALLQKDFKSDIAIKERSEQISFRHQKEGPAKDNSADPAPTPKDGDETTAVPNQETTIVDTPITPAIEEVIEEVSQPDPIVETPELSIATPLISADPAPEKVEEVVPPVSEIIPEVEPEVVLPEVKTEPEKPTEPVVTPEPIVEDPVVEKVVAPEPELAVKPEAEPESPPPAPETKTKTETPSPEPEVVPVVKPTTKPEPPKEIDESLKPKVVGKIDLDSVGKKKASTNKHQDKPKANKGDNKSNHSDKRGSDKKAKQNQQGNNSQKSNQGKKDSFKGKDNKQVPSAKKEQPKVPSHKIQGHSPKRDRPVEGQVERRVVPKLEGPKVVGKIVLPTKEDKNKAAADKKKRKRKRIVKPISSSGNRTGQQNNSRPKRDNRQDRNRGSNNKKKKPIEPTEVSEKEIQDKIKATMAKLSGNKSKSVGKMKKKAFRKEQAAIRDAAEEEVNNVLQVTEFIPVSELAKLMDVAVNKVITVCFNLGIIVSINQRLDAEVIELVADEFGFEVEFISVTEQDEDVDFIEDAEEDLKHRSPIVTIMGHVDHGKTSLLDYVRNASVVAGEVGGITQHIGAYEVTVNEGKQITFLDTPGHEAFTAMRARGAKVTDIAVIVIAADDSIMPQTKEAISHAQAAGVPMIFALNKIDKPEANPEKLKEQLAAMNILVEDWGGTYQCQEISAKTGLNIDELLEKILLEAELLELKANPDRFAYGTVVEASLDKGRGYVCTILVQTGTLNIGDIILAGQYSGRVKAMFNERGQKVKTAGPSQPVLVLGLNGAPQAGDKLRVMESEQEAREMANKRGQILRSQQQRANKHITLDEIGRRLALGTFKELNLIVKGDVDGSVEALSDSLLKLSTEEIQVNIIHRSVGAIKESDVLLATASDAIIIGFQVRPTPNARKQAEQESIDIRTYSIIYDAIEEIKLAMEGMLEPKFEERFVCNIEIREVFKVSKVGTIAGCYVVEGKVNKDTKIRLLRDGVVIFTGEIETLRRYKDDVKEVMPGQECGIAIKNYNDIKVNDAIEGFEHIEIQRKLR